jgi:hypothetical protein
LKNKVPACSLIIENLSTTGLSAQGVGGLPCGITLRAVKANAIFSQCTVITVYREDAHASRTLTHMHRIATNLSGNCLVANLVFIVVGGRLEGMVKSGGILKCVHLDLSHEFILESEIRIAIPSVSTLADAEQKRAIVNRRPCITKCIKEIK